MTHITKKFVKKSMIFSLLFVSFLFMRAVAQKDASTSDLPGNTREAFKLIFKYYLGYVAKNGIPPQDYLQFFNHSQVSSMSEGNDVMFFPRILINKDNKYSTDPTYDDSTHSYNMFFRRPDGSIVGSPKIKGEKDFISYTPIYAKESSFLSGEEVLRLNYGFYLALGDDGLIDKIPIDLIYWSYSSKGGSSLIFPKQAGATPDSLTYQEASLDMSRSNSIPTLKPLSYKLTADNNQNTAPESLVQLSRRLNYPDTFGIEREQLWRVFDLSQVDFTLEQLRDGALKLRFPLNLSKISVSQLQGNGSPALLFLKDDGRIVTLTALDDDRAIVIDRGITRNVERSVLEARYSGEALVPTKALTQQAGLVADDAVRQVQLKSLEDEVPQTVTLRNTGTKPVTLQLEYPLLGVTESKLSKDTLAPGESATLDLKVKWRSVLKAPTQNVLVSLQTSDPIVPRLQLAILLNPPQAAK